MSVDQDGSAVGPTAVPGPGTAQDASAEAPAVDTRTRAEDTPMSAQAPGPERDATGTSGKGTGPDPDAGNGPPPAGTPEERADRTDEAPAASHAAVEAAGGSGDPSTAGQRPAGGDAAEAGVAGDADPTGAAGTTDTPGTTDAAGITDAPGTTDAGSGIAGAPAKDDDAEAGDRWTDFGPEPARQASRLRRTAASVGRFLVHEWTVVSLAAIALAVVMTWPCAWHPASTIPSDIWDPTLQAWQLAWSGHAMLTDPLQLWNSNSFYPDSYSFAFSDTLFGYFPFGLVGTGPTAALVRYNILFILLEALAFVGAYALVRQLGAGRTAAAVAGAAFAYAPWRWAQAGHMHVLSVGGIALSLAMIARGHGFSFTRGYERERTRPGWALAGWCVAAWQISLGFGIGLPFVYVLALVTLVCAVRWLLKGRPALGRRLLLADGVGILVFGAVGLLMGLPYLQVIKQHPEAKRGLAEIEAFSPTLRSFITAPAQSLPWGSAHAAARATMLAPAETTLLPGFMLYGLAAAGLFFSVWSLRTRLWLLAGTLVSVVLAEGTQFYGGGKYTYVVLYKYLPFFSSSRTPGRLIIWTTLLLAILAAGAIGALVGRSYDVAAERGPVANRPGLLMRVATLLPLLLVLAEGTNWHTLQHPVVPSQPAAMRTVDGPLLVLPSDALTDENVMLWSTTKFQKIVNGGSGFYPADQQEVRNVAKSFPDQASVQYLRGLGIRAVVVLKQQAAGSTDYSKAASPDVALDGLGITRQDMGDTFVYQLG